MKVLKILNQREEIDDKFTLKCTNHDIKTEIFQPEDFDKVPEGGCHLICKMRLECGHACESSCHNWIITKEDPTGHQ